MTTIAKQLNVDYFPFEIYDRYWFLIYYEEEDGKWVRYENDLEGFPVYSEESSGYWIKSKYNEMGSLLYWENSEGLWTKWEYDNDGIEIYKESSDEGVLIDAKNNIYRESINSDPYTL